MIERKESGELFWAAYYANGRMMKWAGARQSRKELMAVAVEGCMSATDYYRLADDTARWRHAYRNGCRIKRVRLLPAGGE